jgi:hypothetical protein
MSPPYATNLLDLILAAATADSLSLTSLCLPSLLTAINSSDDRPECIHTLLKAFSSSHTNDIYNLNTSKISKWYGLRTLSKSTTPISTTQFLSNWAVSLPSSIDLPPALELLQGNYFHPTGNTVQYLPSEELASSAQDRLAQLFAIKDRWEIEELGPLMRSCVGVQNDGWEKRVERECQKWARIRAGYVVKR